MYGQTEATARMAYLPPELAASQPAAVGVPIEGGSFGLATGGLIYRGSNVMLDYAEHPADLALGRTVDALATGVLVRRTPDGLYEVIGRKSRFVKLFGLRIDLGHVERLLADAGYSAACTGNDDALVIAVTGNADAARDLVAARCGVPADRVHVRQVDELPRLANDKSLARPVSFHRHPAGDQVGGLGRVRWQGCPSTKTVPGVDYSAMCPVPGGAPALDPHRREHSHAYAAPGTHPNAYRHLAAFR